MPDDAKARLRRIAHEHSPRASVSVPAEDLREVLRELGELRQVTQQQARGILDAGNKALAENRSMGRVFANVAAATALRRCQRLEQALTAIGGPDAVKALFDDA